MSDSKNVDGNLVDALLEARAALKWLDEEFPVGCGDWWWCRCSWNFECKPHAARRKIERMFNIRRDDE